MEEHGNDWDNYCKAIYQEFMDNVVRKNLTFQGLPLSYQRNPEFQRMHCSFWHLITEDREHTYQDKDRTPDMRRCERVSWIAHIINHADDPKHGVKCWENKRGSNKHVVLWIKEEKFLIILARRKTYFLLKTIYCHNERKVQKLREEQDNNKDPRKD